ncbi:Flp pilus assembly protein CpaB [Nocardioides sp.]|uniref:Flp pilus assembly protein CpaB n=1 Tax=Nocardioides sp. TaxID=35761 RepID=UPI0039E364D5
MERRRILVVAAALVAALGAVLVFLYVRGADNRAEEEYDTTQVLVVATGAAPIQPGETFEAAQQAGKIVAAAVTNNSLVPGFLTDGSALSGQVALQAIYPGEQIIASKFGTSVVPQSSLQIPEGQMAISVNLSDPARVAGFVVPGSNVAIYASGTDKATNDPLTALLLPQVQVIGVGSTTPIPTTTTDSSGTQTVEQLPSTLLTVAVDQDQAQKIIYAAGNGELAFALLPADGSTEVKSIPPTTPDNFLSK